MAMTGHSTMSHTTSRPERRRLVALAVPLLLALSSFVVVTTSGIPTASAADGLGTVSNFTGPTTISAPLDITRGPDGNFWFTNWGNNSIGRVTPAGVVTNYTHGSISYPHDITVGPDNNLWFTNSGNNSIGRITTAGVVTNYTHGSISYPHDITSGPDNNLWFTNNTGNSIGRITTAGVVTIFSSPDITGPEGIASGPDGNLWFTNFTDNSIGRITTAGVVTRFTAAPIWGPNGITAGSDGALWFTNQLDNSIGRITTAGAVTSYTHASIRSPERITTMSNGTMAFTSRARDRAVGLIATDGTVSSVSSPSLWGPAGITAAPDNTLWVVNQLGNSISRVGGGGQNYTDRDISVPKGIAKGPDGNMWFASRGNNSIGRITPAGTMTRFTDPAISGLWGITAGSDGNMWFTNGTGVGRITGSGAITFYDDASIWSASDITANIDGNLWFTDTPGAKIGRVTPSGTFTFFTDPAMVDPRSIAPDPDGNLWFIAGPQQIGRLTTGGTFTWFTDASASGLGRITAGPDGNMWFTDASGSSIGRITPTGTVTRFTDPSISSPWAIAAGSDGNVWFTNNTGNSIGRMTTAGVVTSYPDPSIASAQAIAEGPDDNMWFTNESGQSIGRIGTATAPSIPSRPTAVAGDAKAIITWTAPDDGRSPITGYTVRAVEDASKTCTTTGELSCTITGLTNGTSYRFRVRASNTLGTSGWSAASDPVTPSGGVPADATWFQTMAPTRLIDPRPASRVGPFDSPWTHGLVRDVQVAGQAGIPADARAVVLNVTVTDVTSPIGTFISVYPKGGARPNVSSLNASTNQTIANSVTTKIGTGGKISIYNDQQTANVIVDIAGYYTDTPGDGYTALAPTRVIDSRPTWQVGPFATPWGPGQTRDIALGATIPSGSDAVVLNVTATDVTQPSFVTVFPKGGTVPNASNLNLAPGNTIANQVTVKLGGSSQISIFNKAGNLNVVVDVVGYYKAGSGDAFHPVAPQRIIDPRPAWHVGPFSTPWGDQETRSVQITGSAGVPTSAKAVVMNVTATDVISPIGTFVTVFPGDTVPNASNLNASPGWTIANAATAKLSASGKISIYNEKPSANIIVDVNGYFG